MITPELYQKIEALKNDGGTEIVYSSGERGLNGMLIVAFDEILVTSGHTFFVSRWRFISETEWRT